MNAIIFFTTLVVVTILVYRMGYINGYYKARRRMMEQAMRRILEQIEKSNVK